MKDDSSDAHEYFEQQQVLWVDPRHTLQDVCARYLVRQYQKALPDLHKLVVICPTTDMITSMRIALAQAAQALGYAAILGPQFCSLDGWVNERVQDARPSASDYLRQVLLVEALLDHPQFYGQGSPWGLACEMIELFDAMSEWHYPRDASLDEFTQRLCAAYQTDSVVFSGLSREAQLVYNLRHALHEQLESMGLQDKASGYQHKLQQCAQLDLHDTQLYFVGHTHFSPGEQALIKCLLQQQQAKLLCYRADFLIDPHTPYNQHSIYQLVRDLGSTSDHAPCIEATSIFLNAVYQSRADESLISRIHSVKKRYAKNPLAGKVAIFKAANAEIEAQAIDIQCREWLHSGDVHNIGIVTDDRKLARRVRALLERAGLTVDDTSGWALSTTSAATVLERLLECIEQNFHYQPFLDLLKSPFIFQSQQRKKHLTRTQLFERDIVLRENVASGLQRYRDAIVYRSKRVHNKHNIGYTEIDQLLIQFESNTKDLCQLHSEQNKPLHQYLDVLLRCMDSLDITAALQQDDAGINIYNELAAMRAACSDNAINISWTLFRHWLAMNLERYNFKPTRQPQSIKIVSLQLAYTHAFDAVIFAGAESTQLPKQHAPAAFFNNAVRSTLGLPNYKANYNENYSGYRLLLDTLCARQRSDQYRVLFTCKTHNNDELLLPAAWLESIETFCTVAYKDSLRAHDLHNCVESPDAQVKMDHHPLPDKIAAMPQVHIPTALIPTQYSANAYQQLLDCPYKFYSLRCLKLSAPDSVREYLQKSDYGERVHLCLQAFHTDVAGFPGPYNAPIDTHHRDEAIAMLESISQSVFTTDIEINFEHQAWLEQWKLFIPAYIDWQINLPSDQHLQSAELEINAPLDDKRYSVTGRIDRIDRIQQGHKIIDYKTGAIPTKDAILNGEAVQLPFYAVLARLDQISNWSVAQVEYLKFADGKVGSSNALASPVLEQLADAGERRLEQLIQQIEAGAALIAWGDDKTCARCDAKGLCRKQLWPK